MSDLEQLREIAANATAAPWRAAEQTHGEWTGVQDNFSALGSMTTGQDARFVATARNEWNALLDRLEAAEAERDAYRKAKQENDERFQLEAAEWRERASRAEGALYRAFNAGAAACYDIPAQRHLDAAYRRFRARLEGEAHV